MSDDKLKLELVCPEGMILSVEVDEVIVPGSEGDFTVLPHHAPLLSTLRPGILTIHGLKDSKSQSFYVRDGLADISASSLTVLAQTAKDISKLDTGFMDREIRDLEADIAETKDAELLDHKHMELSCLTQTKQHLSGQT